MGIFQIFSIRKQIKKGAEDPGGFFVEQMTDFLKEYLIIGAVIGIIFLTLVGVFAFSSWLGGPFVFAKVVFWIAFVIFVLIEAIFIPLFLKIKKSLNVQADKAAMKIKAKIINKDRAIG